jgi:hypothetical protein
MTPFPIPPLCQQCGEEKDVTSHYGYFEGICSHSNGKAAHHAFVLVPPRLSPPPSPRVERLVVGTIQADGHVEWDPALPETKVGDRWVLERSIPLVSDAERIASDLEFFSPRARIILVAASFIRQQEIQIQQKEARIKELEAGKSLRPAPKEGGA